jgi:hypothetical protein
MYALHVLKIKIRNFNPLARQSETSTAKRNPLLVDGLSLG